MYIICVLKIELDQMSFLITIDGKKKINYKALEDSVYNVLKCIMMHFTKLKKDSDHNKGTKLFNYFQIITLFDLIFF